MHIYSNLDIANKSTMPFLFTIYWIIHYIKCNVISKSSKWEMSFLHYIEVHYIKVWVYLNFHFLYLRNRTTLEVCFSNLRSFFFSFSITRRKNSSQLFFRIRHYTYTIYDEGRENVCRSLRLESTTYYC